jgi:hypothetical protein
VGTYQIATEWVELGEIWRITMKMKSMNHAIHQPKDGKLPQITIEVRGMMVQMTIQQIALIHSIPLMMVVASKLIVKVLEDTIDF